MKRFLKGFSLIELLIVITIIGILAVVFLPKITSGPERARDAKRISDVADIANAIEMYKQDIGNYPIKGAIANAEDFLPGVIGDYFDSGLVPEDPIDAQYYEYTGSRFGLHFAILAHVENPKGDGNYYDRNDFASYPVFLWTDPPTLSTQFQAAELGPADLADAVDPVYVYLKYKEP